MLDIKFLKENTEYAKERLKLRNHDYSAEIDEAIALDTERRALIADTEAKKAEQNRISKQIPALKKEGKDVAPIFEEMKVLSDTVKAEFAKIDEIDKRIADILLSVPNIPNPTLPVGNDDSANVEIRRWGEPTKTDFEPKAHWDLGKELNILDPDTAAKITGARFHVYRGLGARLERAIISYYLDTHTEHGYTEIFPPFMVNRDSMKGTGQLPKFEEDAFRVANNDYF
ncbi:MAG: serine--tRNA ligase, partial [Clostridia bacterium]|nr:serine--tRNA ligase [Clostridia bacterium]